MEYNLIASRRYNANEYVILCELPGTFHPWVTWRSDTPDGSGERYWGHYFKDVSNAAEDFKNR
jgi:hypothetical protein